MTNWAMRKYDIQNKETDNSRNRLWAKNTANELR